MPNSYIKFFRQPMIIIDGLSSIIIYAIRMKYYWVDWLMYNSFNKILQGQAIPMLNRYLYAKHSNT